MNSFHALFPYFLRSFRSFVTFNSFTQLASDEERVVKVAESRDLDSRYIAAIRGGAKANSGYKNNTVNKNAGLQDDISFCRW